MNVCFFAQKKRGLNPHSFSNTCILCDMVLSSPDNQAGGSPPLVPDVAACRKKSWRARLWGSCGGRNPISIQSQRKDVGRHGHGNLATGDTRSVKNELMGRWERCNFNPTGGRQHAGDGMSGNGAVQGDDLTYQGAAVLRGAACADRRIAQACHACQKPAGLGCLTSGSVVSVPGTSGTPDGLREQWTTDVWVNRELGTSARLKASVRLTAQRSMSGCAAYYTIWKQGGSAEERGSLCTPHPRVVINPGGAEGERLMSRFERVEQGLPRKPRDHPRVGRKLPSGKQTRVCCGRKARTSAGTPGIRTVRAGPHDVSTGQGVTPLQGVIKCSPRFAILV